MPHDHRRRETLAPRRTILRAAFAVLHFLCQWTAWLARNPAAWSTTIARTLLIVRQGGIASIWGAVLYKSIARQSGTDANAWYQRYRRRAARSDRTREVWPGDAPLLRIVVSLALLDERGCRRLLESAHAQGYPHWELWCLAPDGAETGAKRYAAHFASYDPRVRLTTVGESAPLLLARDTIQRELYVLLAERVLEFVPGAFAQLAEGVATSHADVVYGDHLLADADGVSQVREVAALPGYSYEYFLASGYFAGGAAVCARVLEQLDPAVLQRALACDSFELLLHALERAHRIMHVPALVAHWNVASPDLDERARAVRWHLACVGHSDVVQARHDLGVLDVGAAPIKEIPTRRVAIVIPTRDARPLLEQCIESLEATGALERADLWIVDHLTQEPDAVTYLERLAQRHHVVRATGDFNFSRLVNQGVAAAGRDYSHYLLLNNDIEATEAGWLDHLLATAGRPEVGAVGATLLYPDGAIQHAGVVLGMRGLAGHYHLGTSFHDESGIRRTAVPPSLVATREVSAVTAACVLVSHEAWHAVGGFDTNIAVGYGDVDFCLRLQMAGFRILHDPHALLVHHESRSRGRAVWDPHPADTKCFLRRYHGVILAGDPFYSPLLSNVLTQGQLGGTLPGTPRITTRNIPRPISLPRGIIDCRDDNQTPVTRTAA
ncbi:MAG: glycosyltransferase [Pirellulales bacterium]|nr:glycosyltransferase [Pirellulales bacterium]